MTRRGHGEGTIHRRADGRWCAAITVDGLKRKYFYGRTRRGVQEQLTTALRDKQQGTLITAPSQTLAQYLTHWLENVAKPRLRPRTFEDYRGMVTLHIIPAIGKHQLTKVTPQQLSGLYNEKLAAGLSARRVQYLHAVLHTAFKQALVWNLIVRNPADAVQAPRPKRRDIAPLSPEDARAFLGAIQGDPLEALYVLALTSGMRQGELLGLQWRDVQIQAGKLQVRHSLVRRAGGWTLEEPKTERSRRSITLTERATAALRTHRTCQLQSRLVAGDEWEDNDLVFCNAFGRPLDGKHLLTRYFHPLLAKAGLPRMRFHDLRHTAATLLLAQGVHAKVVQDLLGHSTITLTMDLYSHVLPNMHQEAADKMDSLLRG